MSHVKPVKLRQSPEDVVLIHLRRYLLPEELEFIRKVSAGTAERIADMPIIRQFELGIKNTEYREASARWIKTLTRLKNPDVMSYKFFPRWKGDANTVDLSCVLKKKRAWLVEGYPKNSLPRLEADIAALWMSLTTKQLGIVLLNLRKEV